MKILNFRELLTHNCNVGSYKTLGIGEKKFNELTPIFVSPEQV